MGLLAAALAGEPADVVLRTLCAAAATPLIPALNDDGGGGGGKPRANRRKEHRRVARKRRTASSALAKAAAITAAECFGGGVGGGGRDGGASAGVGGSGGGGSDAAVAVVTSSAELFRACGTAAAFSMLRVAMGASAPHPTAGAIKAAALRACAGGDARELNDLLEAMKAAAAAAVDDSEAFGMEVARAWSAVAAAEGGIGRLTAVLISNSSIMSNGGEEGAAAAAAAEVAAAVVPLGAAVPAWQPPILAALEAGW